MPKNEKLGVGEACNPDLGQVGRLKTKGRQCQPHYPPWRINEARSPQALRYRVLRKIWAKRYTYVWRCMSVYTPIPIPAPMSMHQELGGMSMNW